MYIACFGSSICKLADQSSYFCRKKEIGRAAAKLDIGHINLQISALIPPSLANCVTRSPANWARTGLEQRQQQRWLGRRATRTTYLIRNAGKGPVEKEQHHHHLQLRARRGGKEQQARQGSGHECGSWSHGGKKRSGCVWYMGENGSIPLPGSTRSERLDLLLEAVSPFCRDCWFLNSR